VAGAVVPCTVLGMMRPAEERIHPVAQLYKYCESDGTAFVYHGNVVGDITDNECIAGNFESALRISIELLVDVFLRAWAVAGR
jgi:hypothetical protein